MMSCMVSKTMGEGIKSRLGGLQVVFAPPDNGGNNLVAQWLPQWHGHTFATAYANTAIFALVKSCHSRKHENVASFGFANKASNHGDELVLNGRGCHGRKERKEEPLGPLKE